MLREGPSCLPCKLSWLRSACICSPTSKLGMLQVKEQDISLGLHLLANGLVWLSVDGSKEGSQQHLLLQQLSALPKTHAVSVPLPAS